MGDLVEALRRHQRMGIDTPIFTYHIEQAPRWAPTAGRALRALADGHYSGVTSVITLLKLVIRPLRLGRPEVADAYESLVQDINNLAVVAIDQRVSRLGAGHRASHRLRTSDALQIAACLVHGATAFLTNDRRLRRIEEIEILLLDDFVGS